MIKNGLGCQWARLDTIILNKDNLEFYNENKLNSIGNKSEMKWSLSRQLCLFTKVEFIYSLR